MMYDWQRSFFVDLDELKSKRGINQPTLRPHATPAELDAARTENGAAPQADAEFTGKAGVEQPANAAAAAAAVAIGCAGVVCRR